MCTIALNNKNKESSNNSISSCSENKEEKSESELSSEEEDVDRKVVSASDKSHVNNSAPEVKNKIYSRINTRV